MDSVLLARLERALSGSRIQTYKNRCASDEESIVLYLWNMALAESLYSSLSCLEVALRSAMHNVLTATLGPGWFAHVFKGQALRDYHHLVHRLTRGAITPPDSQIVANLTFGKWVNLVVNGRCQWVDQAPYPLYRVFPNYTVHSQLERNKIHVRLLYVLELRNRVMHHEPIFAGVRAPNKSTRPLDQNHADIVTAIGWFGMDLEKTVRHIDRFESVFTDGKQAILANLPRRYATLYEMRPTTPS